MRPPFAPFGTGVGVHRLGSALAWIGPTGTFTGSTVNQFSLSATGMIAHRGQFVRHRLHLAGLYRRNWRTCDGRDPGN